MARFSKTLSAVSSSNQACYFLRGSDDSIDDIARKTGFSSRSYFDKVFKSVFRQTPRDYRNRFK
ncbi:helix-turn-helix domain-containing protein [Streptococcus sp. H49]|uniref:helix-turn-helix domain-containing protein n=1 Tax=Streptococcus huangxiaojuni TaxID=3237239 RepID=UPI0034A56DD9